MFGIGKKNASKPSHIYEFADSMRIAESDLRSRSFGIMSQRAKESLPPIFSTTFTLATGASITKHPVIDLGRYTKSIQVRSDRDITIQINDARDYKALEYANRDITIYANSPMSIDVEAWKVKFTNASGSTANIRFAASAEPTRVMVV